MSKRILITGGTRGIGKAISVAMKNAGYKVAASYAGNDEAAHECEAELGIKVFKWDVADFEACTRGVGLVKEYLGGNIEVLVNNAGITRDAMMHKQSLQGWQDVIHTNLGSVFNMSKLVLDEMRTAKYGRIINMSSVNAHGAMGQTNYAAAKAGIEGLTRSLALETARLGITVNAIAPGYTNTEMVAQVPADALAKVLEKVPMNRLGQAEEIAAVAEFLASDKAAFITGAVIPVNGGFRM